MQSGDITVEAKDGACISAKIYSGGKKEVNGILIVCHGFGEHSGRYTELAENLVQEDYVCIVFNQRGHGELPKEKLGVIPSYQSFLDDVGAVVAEIKQKLPNIPIVLYGHSMGGNIAANYLLKHNQSDFTCAILEAPWLGLHKEIHPFKAGAAKLSSSIFPDKPLPEKDTKLPLSDITSDKEKQKELEEDPLYHNRMSMRMFTEIGNGCVYAIDNASSLSIPTLLAVALDEKIVSNKAIDAFYDKCGSNVAIKKYASCHSIHNDVMKKDLYADIIAFLNKHCCVVQPA